MQFNKAPIIRIVVIILLLIAILVLGIVTCSLSRYMSRPLPMSEEYAFVAERKLRNEYDGINEDAIKEAYIRKEKTRTIYEENYIKTLTPDSPIITGVKERRLVPLSPVIISSAYSVVFSVPPLPSIINAEIFTIEKELIPPPVPQGEYHVIRTPDSPHIASVSEETIKVPLTPQITNVEVIVKVPPSPLSPNAEIVIVRVPSKPEIIKVEEKQTLITPSITKTDKPIRIRILRYTLEIKKSDYNNAILTNIDTNERFIGSVDPSFSTFIDNNTSSVFII